MKSIEQFTEELLSLPNQSRAILAEKLVEGLEFDVDGSVSMDWIATAKQRRDEIRSGAVLPIEGDEALAKIRKLLK